MRRPKPPRFAGNWRNQQKPLETNVRKLVTSAAGTDEKVEAESTSFGRGLLRAHDSYSLLLSASARGNRVGQVAPEGTQRSARQAPRETRRSIRFSIRFAPGAVFTSAVHIGRCRLCPMRISTAHASLISAVVAARLFGQVGGQST